MAKNLNSTSFIVLLLVIAMALTGILKSEAAPFACPSSQTGCIIPKFYGECGPTPYTGTDAACCDCCLLKYGRPPVCGAIVEGTHCHCYSNL